jgi:hypothetical protein
LKADIFNRKYFYSLRGNGPNSLVEIPVDVVKNIQRLNKSGKRPEKIILEKTEPQKKETDIFHNMVGQDDLNRFDNPAKNSRKKKRHHNRNKQQNR